MKLYIIAGEPSGDLHGSNLIKGIKSIDPDCQIRCWGGDLMQNAGGKLVKHYKESAVMGFWEVFKNLGKISKNLSMCKKDILDFSPDAVVLIDYPGFNFRIAKFAHNHKFKVFYYIAPKIWAWKESRGKRLKKYVDKLFIIFPFEISYFKERWNIDAIYNGNPLLDSVEQNPQTLQSREDFCKEEGLDCANKFIALIPGSRRSEISYLLPTMIELVKQYPNHKFLITQAPSITDSYYTEIITAELKKMEQKGVNIDELKNRFILLKDKTYAAMKHSDAAVVSSGTASLECALIGTPQVVCYAASELSYIIAQQLVKGIKYISLANLILDKQIFIELLQHDYTVEKVSKELDKLLYDNSYRDNMIADYNSVKEILGGGGASNKVAKVMLDAVSENAVTESK